MLSVHLIQAWPWSAASARSWPTRLPFGSIPPPLHGVFLAPCAQPLTNCGKITRPACLPAAVSTFPGLCHSAVLSQQSLSRTQRGPWVWAQHCVCLAQQHLSGTCFAWRSLSQSLRSGLRGFLGLGLCPLGPLHPWAAVSVGMYSVVGATVLSLEFHMQK